MEARSLESLQRGQTAAQGRRAVVRKNQRRHFDSRRKIDFLKLRLRLHGDDGRGLARFYFAFAGNGHVCRLEKRDWSHFEIVIRQSAASRVYFGGP